MYVPLSRVLLRAPLLPVGALARARRALLAHPLGATAIEIASPTLAGAKPGAARGHAINRYARRAAFRPTPSGLLAGVCLGTLGRKTDLATGAPAAHLTPSWARLNALARALVDDPAIRERVRLRAAPSTLRGAATVHWVGHGDPFAAAHAADLDDRLTAILDVTDRWRPWPEVRASARGGDADPGDDADADELLLVLIDDGLLQTDLAPPLVGAAPGERLRDRLAAIGRPDEARALEVALRALGAGDLARGRAALASLPGRSERDVHAVLVHRPRRTPRLERAAVERAARLVPLLVRLQEHLAPPTAERFASQAIADALDASTEIFGAGAFDLAALAAGEYGVDVARDDEEPPAVATPAPALLALLTETIAKAAAGGQMEAELGVEALAVAVGDRADTPLPPTVELFLAPTPRRPGGRPGAGWLLGLHAPAGASLGRFAHALGAPLEDACTEIAAAERRAHPDEERLDVAFAPSPALADLCAHPKVRPRTLALTRWTDAGDDLTPRDLELLADPAAPAALSLRTRDAGTPIVPSPLARVRSSTAPAGLTRLLVGWSLQRQHAPWAFSPGPLADLAFIPRLRLDGFVIAPASWRPPPELRRRGARTALSRWRRTARVPRFVQIGEGDQLFPVDLLAPEAPAALAGLPAHARIFEIWPPLDAGVDRDGRRIEAVVAVVATADDAAPAARDTRSAGRVPPPREAPPLPGWRTFKLFGIPARQDELLDRAVIPAIRRAQAAHEIDAWFFLRYVDGPGCRPHLRLRVHGVPSPAAFEARLLAAMVPARESGALATIEIGEYHAEVGRLPAGDLPVAHAIFESDSEAAAALLADPELDRILLLTQALDALATGLGLNLDERHALAHARRQTAEAWTGVDDEARRQVDADFRRHGRTLRAALGGASEISPTGEVLASHRARIALAARDLPADARARLLPTLLHLCAVRFAGPDPDAERIAYTFWERTLEGLRKPPGQRRR